MANFEKEQQDAFLPAHQQDQINANLHTAAYSQDWLRTEWQRGTAFGAGVGKSFASSLRRRASSNEGRTQLLEEAGLATAFGAMLPVWRTTPCPVACALGGAAFLFMKEKLDPAMGKNDRRNVAVSSALANIIGHRGGSLDKASDDIANALGDDAADLCVTGGFFLAGALPRLARMSCGSLSIYTTETCRYMFERPSPVLTRVACAAGASERSACSAEELSTWVEGLNQRGLRATLNLSENGLPRLEPPPFAELSKAKESVFPQAAWWRNPAHPQWRLPNPDQDIADPV